MCDAMKSIQHTSWLLKYETEKIGKPIGKKGWHKKKCGMTTLLNYKSFSLCFLRISSFLKEKEN